ncbi:MAG: hypothetical protein A3I05_02270 [Deltaproteobacteria bacterium RIFCSPLOWO2_02_FULL_44_10]|nr:MAG: hypothetical protein A3C46_08435 [Deltaproteobacteria bacterium RIFCSPHIGHO2_02_FULL_44_16]OGQ47601.1 MAG: hypothetical protein A3I05_02270 [Deltaproteobacteria bacterium RIFCSPLOWO2_02_FULL_44_10]
MQIEIRTFAHLKERLSFEQKTVDVPEGTHAGELFSKLTNDQHVIDYLTRYTRCAVNCHFVPLNTILHDGDTVALIPPTAGG